MGAAVPEIEEFDQLTFREPLIDPTNYSEWLYMLSAKNESYRPVVFIADAEILHIIL